MQFDVVFDNIAYKKKTLITYLKYSKIIIKSIYLAVQCSLGILIL